MIAEATAPEHDSAATLVLEGVVKQFRGVRALDGVSLDVGEGEILGLIGPNGSGKTTLLNVSSGVLRPTRAGSSSAGVDATGASRPRGGALGVGRTFQQIRLFSEMTVAENVEVGAVARAPRASTACRSCSDGSASRGSPTGSPGRSPYGQQRRAEIARALAGRPRFLLLDEPAAGMNEAESDALLETIRAIRDDEGCAILIVDHDLRLIMRLCERIHVLAEGRTIGEGTPDEVRRDPAVIDAYLGTTAAPPPEPPPDERLTSTCRERLNSVDSLSRSPRRSCPPKVDKEELGMRRRVILTLAACSRSRSRRSPQGAAGATTAVRPRRPQPAATRALRRPARVRRPRSGSGEPLTLRIGFSGALAGPYAAYDVPLQNGMEFAAQQINAAGGPVTVEIVVQEQQGRPDADADDHPGAPRRRHQRPVMTTADAGSRAASSYLDGRRHHERRGQHRAAIVKRRRRPRLPFVFGDNLQASAGAAVRLRAGLQDGVHARLARDPVHEGHADVTSRTPSPSIAAARSSARTRYKIGQTEFGTQVTKIQNATRRPT